MTDSIHQTVRVTVPCIKAAYNELFGGDDFDSSLFYKLLAPHRGRISYAILQDWDRQGLISAGEFDAVDSALDSAHQCNDIMI